MMKTRERTVTFHDLLLRCKLKGINAPIQPMETAHALSIGLQHFQEARANNTSFTAASGARIVALEDWQAAADGREHQLVLSCADPSWSDVAFKNLATGASRMANKAPEEAIDKSCHVLLRPGAAAGEPALMLQTSDSGVSADKVCTVLNRVLKAASSTAAHQDAFARNHPNGIAGHVLKLLCTFEACAHQSEMLQDILQHGRIDGVELISEGLEGVDGDDGYQVVSRTVHVSVVDNAAGRSLARLKRLFNKDWHLQHHISKARVHYRETQEGPKKSHMFEAAAMDAAFTKREHVDFDFDLLPKYAQIDMRVIDKMRELL